MAFRHGERGLISVLKKRGYRYILIGLIDVQANTLLATSHQYTTLTSIQVFLRIFCFVERFLTVFSSFWIA